MKANDRSYPFLREGYIRPVRFSGNWRGGNASGLLSRFKVLPGRPASTNSWWWTRNIAGRNIVLPAVLCFTMASVVFLPMLTTDAESGSPDAALSDPANEEHTGTLAAPANVWYAGMTAAPADVEHAGTEAAPAEEGHVGTETNGSFSSLKSILPLRYPHLSDDADLPPASYLQQPALAPAPVDERYLRMASIPIESLYIKITPAVEATDDTTPDAVSVLIDGEKVLLAPPALLTGSTTYVPLYDFCRTMGQVTINQDDDSATVFLANLQIVAMADNCYITANGRYLYSPSTCRIIDNVMFVPVRPLAKAFGAAVVWDSRLRTVSVLTAFESFENGDTFYDETDLYWMSRIICAEARGECLDGKIAVGNVVMNRLHSSVYPNTVRGVIFDNSCGVQFTPAYSGAINNTPDSECVIAAKLALDGANIVGDSMFFNVARLSSWAARNRTFVTTIGNHSFFS